MARIQGYSQAHQPMLHAMSAILVREGIKELYFRDFLQSSLRKLSIVFYPITENMSMVLRRNRHWQRRLP